MRELLESDEAAPDRLGWPEEFDDAGRRALYRVSSSAFVLDLEEARAQTVGAYYLARSLLILPPGIAGGLLWARHAQAPFWAAAAVGAVGVLYFMIV